MRDCASAYRKTYPDTTRAQFDLDLSLVGISIANLELLINAYDAHVARGAGRVHKVNLR